MPAASLAILDTSVYVDNLRSGRFEQEILNLKFVIRCSAVVLAELSRRARSRTMRTFVDDLAKNLRVIAPNAYLFTCNVDDFNTIHETFDFNLVCW